MLDGCYFFFFTSRRRHTKYWRDWSSDVCSSDLTEHLRQLADHRPVELQGGPGGRYVPLGRHLGDDGERRAGEVTGQPDRSHLLVACPYRLDDLPMLAVAADVRSCLGPVQEQPVPLGTVLLSVHGLEERRRRAGDQQPVELPVELLQDAHLGLRRALHVDQELVELLDQLLPPDPR